MSVSSVILDSSALLGIFLNENDKDWFLKKITFYERRYMGAANYLESGQVVIGRVGIIALEEFYELVKVKLALIIEPFTQTQAEIAHQAFARYGKGQNPVRLNMGDCFAYALAKDKNLPLLAKGVEFEKTDIQLVKD